MSRQLKILLGQLNSNGDCLYATTIARQIKKDYPGSHLTWAIASFCRQVIKNNPDVDAVWEIPAENKKDERKFWNEFEKEAKEKLERGEFDKIFLTQIFPNNIQNYDGTVRASIFRGYPNPITVPVNPVINLTEEEVNNVKEFAEKHGLKNKKNVILFECSSASGQSFVTPEYAIGVSKLLLERLPGAAVILSTHKKIETDVPGILDGSKVSFRENAELTKYCTLFVGCSSGVSWICTSTWAKPLPMIQVLKGNTSVYASMIHDAEYFKLPSGHIIEIFDCTEMELAECIIESIGDFKEAKMKYNRRPQVRLNHYFRFVLSVMVKGFFKGHFFKGLKSFKTTYSRYGFAPFRRLLTGG
jgi:hypothetical protein